MIRIVSNSILFRFFTGMYPGRLLNFFANLKLLLSKKTRKFLLIIYGKSKVEFELDWNHMISALHFKCSLKQKQNMTRYIFKGIWPNLKSNLMLSILMSFFPQPRKKLFPEVFHIILVRPRWGRWGNFKIVAKGKRWDEFEDEPFKPT